MLTEDIKKALRIVNDMEKKGIIGKHAIGGSIGAISDLLTSAKRSLLVE